MTDEPPRTGEGEGEERGQSRIRRLVGKGDSTAEEASPASPAKTALGWLLFGLLLLGQPGLVIIVLVILLIPALVVAVIMVVVFDVIPSPSVVLAMTIFTVALMLWWAGLGRVITKKWKDDKPNW